MDDSAEKRWNELVADLAEGRVSVLEAMRAGQSEIEVQLS